MAVLMVRRNGTLHAIGNTCSHAGGPLNEGKLEGDVIECPWHGSKFCVRDGNVKSGPATFPQPLFDVRESGGTVEVSLLTPRHK
jgi:Ferredoxin subunits of nitrite reductase and ring-hydroxylating dioxygenases